MLTPSLVSAHWMRGSIAHPFYDMAGRDSATTLSSMSSLPCGSTSRRTEFVNTLDVAKFIPLLNEVCTGLP